MAMAACYLLLPYTRMALVDSGQLVPAALIVLAVFWHLRPSVAGVLIGLAAGWMPACLGLIPLWCGYLPGPGAGPIRQRRRAAVALGCALLGLSVPELANWARALGARSIDEVGLFPLVRAQVRRAVSGSSIDSSFRLPVLIAYLALVIVTMIWPADKNLAELIALSAALLVASQFWYLDKGGTLVMLYLPLAILMMFRPTITGESPSPPRSSPPRAVSSVKPVS